MSKHSLRHIFATVTALLLLATAAPAVDLIGLYEFEGNYNNSTGPIGAAVPTQNPGQVSFTGSGFRGQAVDINDPEAAGNGNNSAGTVDIPFNVSPPNAVSFGGWVNLDNKAGFRAFAANDNGGWDRGIHLNGSNWGIASGGNTDNVAPSVVGQWQYVVGTFDKTSNLATLYVGDDVAATQTTMSGVRADGAANNGGLASLEIGRFDNQEFDGQVDDFVIWDAALTADQANAVRNLRLNTSLDYSPADAELLFDLFDAGMGSVVIDDTTWTPGVVAGTNPGELFDLGGGNFQLRLNGTGGGLIGTAPITAPAPVPEPTAMAIWLLLGVIGFGFGWRKVRRRS